MSQESVQIHHTPTLFAEPIFHIGSFQVTNSLLNSWVVVFFLIVFSCVIRARIRTIPKGIQNFFEMILEHALSLADSATGSREKTMKFMPMVLPLFLFILLNNWFGIFPGVGSIGFIETHQDENVFVPLFRGGTADLNTTLALGISSVLLTHIFGAIMTGTWGHLNKFINGKLLAEIPRKIFKEKEYTAIIINPIHFFVGIIEMVGEAAKIASLSFRLFGNIFAGEVLISAMAAIFAFAVPIPFLFLEIIIGLIQALIFAMLVLVFLTVMTTSQKEHEAPS